MAHWPADYVNFIVNLPNSNRFINIIVAINHYTKM